MTATNALCAQGLEEIASRTYLEKFTRKDDPDVIGAAIVSYGIDVLTDYARQSQHKEPPCSDSVTSVPSFSTAASESSVRNAVRDLIMGSDDDELLVESVTQFAINYARQFQELLHTYAEERKAAKRELAEAKFSPAGDNHHNAAKCPYCNPEYHNNRIAQERVVELERELDIQKQLVEELRPLLESSEAALHAACHELDRLIAKYVCWNSACKDESHVQIKAKAAELRGSK